MVMSRQNKTRLTITVYPNFPSVHSLAELADAHGFEHCLNHSINITKPSEYKIRYCWFTFGYVHNSYIFHFSSENLSLEEQTLLRLSYTNLTITEIQHSWPFQ